MAKTGFWLKGAKGKLAGTTLYKDPTTGETIMREVVTPSNPKTEAQLVQRVIMATIGAAYSLTKEITDHSFEGLKAGRETMSYFMKQNINFCREKVQSMLAEGLLYDDIYNFVKPGQRGFVPNQYQLSMGSLPAVTSSLYRKNIGGANVQLVGLVQEVKTNTYQSVIDALGLKRGDQLTFVTIEQVGISDVEFKFSRVILDPTDPDTYAALPLNVAFIGEDNKVNAPSVRNEGNFKFDVTTSGLQFVPARLRQQNGISGCAVIVSRKVGDVWNRSTSYLAYQEGIGYSLAEAIEAAKGATISLYTPSELYLNNAGEGGGAAANSGSDSGGEDVEPSVGGLITNVDIDNVSAVQGTTKQIIKSEGTSFPVEGEVQITAASAADNLVVSIVGNSNETIASESVDNGIAVLTGNFAANTIYRILIDGESTGYSFQYVVASGGDSDEDE